MIFNLSDTPSLANRFLADIRSVDRQSDAQRFRTNLQKLGEILAFELSKSLNYAKQGIETPLGIADMDISTDQLVIATILRAGLPMHQGFLNFFPNAENAFVSAYREHHKDGNFDIKMQYLTSPNVQNKVLIVCDPMLATGASMEKVIQALIEHKSPSRVIIAAIIASQYGIERMRRIFPKIDIYVGAIDEELTAKSYIVPGLGDAGDLAFGSKIQD